ncbi:MAG: ABC transporter permease [Vicinamibacterales bacterium]
MTPAPHRDPRLPRPARLFMRLLSRDSASTDLEADVAELFASRRRDRGAIYAWWRLAGDLWSVTWRRRRVASPGAMAVASAERGWPGSSWLGDARHAFRWLRRYPSLTVPALISLSLAIGAGTAVFSVLNATFLREYLAADASIVWVWRLHENGAARTWRPAEFLALRRLAKTVTLEGALSRAALLPVAPAPAAGAGEGDGDGAPASVAFVTDGYLQTFAPPPAAGRLLDPADAQPDAAPAAVVSHRFWRRALGGDRSAVGRQIRVAGTPVRIVGVAARDYVDPSDGTPDVWVPFSWFDVLAASTPQASSTPRLAGYGHLHPGTSATAADAELTALVREASPGGYPGDPPATAVEQGPVKSAAEIAREQRIVLVVMGLVAIVLGLACANVSNLLLAGATTRDREIGVRLALGAGIGRIVRQMVVESLTLTTCATVAGALVAARSAPAMAVLAGMPDADVAIDRRVLFFLAAAALLVGIGAALAPARHAVRGSVSQPLTAAGPAVTTGRRTSGMRSVLVGVQAAASLVLLVLAALFARTLLHVTRLDPGFDVDRLVYVSARPAGPRPSAADEVRARDYWTAALGRVRTLPASSAPRW